MIKDSFYKIFWSFFKVGAFTFGGGWAMISIIEKEVVHKHHWVERDEFLDLLAIAQAMPGILAVNIAVVVGDRLRGVKGSLCAALGSIIPSFLMILAIAIFLTPETIKNNETLNAMFKGIRPAVVALILAPLVTSAKVAKLNRITIFIPIVTALLIYSGLPYISNPIIFIILGIAGGYLYYVISSHQNNKTRKEDNE
ncbi:MAG: chromate transporter [Muribaculaceae bacterium]|jgi:chromate transporter|nr:chromate transporter [Muribaculaceae bacterium]MEE1339077.1 chromate transporter [Muribaculaceae bacterium]